MKGHWFNVSVVVHETWVNLCIAEWGTKTPICGDYMAKNDVFLLSPMKLYIGSEGCKAEIYQLRFYLDHVLEPEEISKDLEDMECSRWCFG
jgi:hypothetical protein